jgi:hypothetical protein
MRLLLEHLPKVLSEKNAAAQPVERRHFARAVGNYSRFAHSLPTACGARILFSEILFGKRSKLA